MTHQEQKDWTENVRWADDRQSLIDDFAKAAMQGELAAQSEGFSLWVDGFEPLAKRSYDIATAMMQERERRMKRC